MDESQFIKNERPNEFEALFEVSGEVRVTIHADSIEDARRKANEMIEANEIALDPEDVDNVDLSRVWKSRPMYLVTRDAQKMQVSILNEGDLPRQPDERGF